MLGYLRPEAGGHVPLTPFGRPVADVLPEPEARAVLDALGLSYLADPWFLELPGREDPVTVRIVEVTPERMRVANADHGYEEADIGHLFVLRVPEPGRLRPGPGGVGGRG
ncbi:hypothetical protein GCM10007079_16340 [Nocardiopsis terrae]|uniref:Uncharacterized protein n=1 Tax=Nocardiopsis terrae TaxID=372655 RepID=A0ABR9HI78_9ACTN|nr:hypothetical protein [Nocardiopsis terrae]MBE1458737.1 hypothetical protein [Nocardiopsis terrae]GHC78768.1 hypothetical protein GCM10007079_16340 [Nocardiopsis terrae]